MLFCVSVLVLLRCVSVCCVIGCVSWRRVVICVLRVRVGWVVLSVLCRVWRMFGWCLLVVCWWCFGWLSWLFICVIVCNFLVSNWLGGLVWWC